MIDKQDIYDLCLTTILEKEQGLKSLITATRESNNDTKSSMGDKYETSREMLQQEINMLEKQLAEVNDQYQLLKKIKVMPSKKVSLGSLIEFELGKFFIAVGIGEIKLNNNSIMTISVNSPLAKAILGKNVGDNFSINNKTFAIRNVI